MIKTFNWLPKYNLVRHDSPTGRMYETPEGNRYQSVTSFLGQFKQEALENWKNAVGNDVATATSQRAANRGTKVHAMAEEYLLEGAIPKINTTTTFLDTNNFKIFKPTLDRIDNIHAIEYYLYSDTFKLAGAVDCVAEFDGVLSVIDFKTSSNMKERFDIDSYFLQTAIYSFMIQEMYNITIRQLVVPILVDQTVVQVFTESRSVMRDKLQTLLESRNGN